jgi:hypothetical protein
MPSKPPELIELLRGVPDQCTTVAVALNPTADSDWDSALGSMQGGTFFHSSAWAAVLRDSFGFRPSYLALMDGGSMKACLPLFEAGSWLAGRRGVSLPFTDECSPLAALPGQSNALIASALAKGLKRRWRFVEFRGGDGLLRDQPESHVFLGHRLGLKAPVGQLFAGFESSVQRAIRKGERANVAVEVSDTLEAVGEFYELQCRTRRRHGLPPQPLLFFRNLHRHVLSRGHGFISLARQRGRAIAASVFLHSGTRAIYKYGASDERFQQLRGNNLVMWEAIKRFANQGFEELTFGRTSPEEDGLRRFKLGWGAEEYPITYRRYDFSKQQFVSTKDRAHGWHNHLFRAMPLPILRFAGARLYRHLI